MGSFYEETGVYRAAFNLSRYLEGTVRYFDRHNKYAIGLDLRNLARRILVLVAKANTKKYRVKSLEEAIEALTEMKMVVQLAKEISAFRTIKGYEVCSKAVLDITKQCEGRLRISQNLSNQ